MSDFNNLPEPINVEIFTGGRSGTGSRTGVWNKPRNCQNIGIICVGGGGGGQSAPGGVAGTLRIGGGGGGNGGVVSIYLPSLIVPNTLYYHVGSGGTTGFGGQSSFICLTGSNITNITVPICIAGGGSAGSGSTGGAAGSSGGTSGGNVILLRGMVTSRGSTSAQAGQNASTTANNASVSPAYQLTSGGAGGAVSSANIAYLGGTIAANPPIFTNTIAASSNGDTVWQENGYMFSSRGGGGGNGNAGGQGGRGGDGGLGCGGGGGGGGTTGAQAGRGGDGVIIIVTW